MNLLCFIIDLVILRYLHAIYGNVSFTFMVAVYKFRSKGGIEQKTAQTVYEHPLTAKSYTLIQDNLNSPSRFNTNTLYRSKIFDQARTRQKFKLQYFHSQDQLLYQF